MAVCKTKKFKKRIEGGGTNDPMKAVEIIKKAGKDILDEIDFKAIIKDTFNLLYDILTGGEKTEAEFTRRVLEKLYMFTGGNNCAIKKELCSNPDLLYQIKAIYNRLYTTIENGIFSYATNTIAVVPGYGPAIVAVINALKIGKDVKKGVYDEFHKAVKIVNTIKSTTQLASSNYGAKAGGTKKHKKLKKLTIKQIKHITKTYLHFLNLILYVKKKYNKQKKNKNNKNNKNTKTQKHKNTKTQLPQ